MDQAQFLREYKLVVVGGGGELQLLQRVTSISIPSDRCRKILFDYSVHPESFR